MKKFSIKTRFRIGAAVISLVICTSVAIIVYVFLKDLATERIYRETEIFIGTADATRLYVKDVLRPTIADMVSSDDFIPNAMSTTFVGREVMSRLRNRFPHFSYKRASDNPTNPMNRADSLEVEKLTWFRENPDRGEWHGLIRKGDRSYYARFRAILAEAECLRCHGDPKDAPRQMKEIYGTAGGFYYRVGEVVAADTIYIPVDVAFLHVKETAWNIFLIAAISLFALLGLFFLLFNRTVILQMDGLLSRFRSIYDKPDNAPEILRSMDTADEFEQLKFAFEKVAVDLKQTHDELRASESKYRTLFESSRDTIIICDRENRLVDINEAGLTLFGFQDKAEALSIETCYQLFWDTRDARTLSAMIQNKGYVEGVEMPMVDRQGQRLIVMISGARRLDEDGMVDGIDARLHDVTRQRKMERHLARTEKLASIGELASGVAHEINNPLGVIRVYSNLIAKTEPLDIQIAEDIRVIQKHTEQCTSVVQALLNFARASEPRKSQCDIRSCLDDVLAVLEPQMRKEAVTVHVEADSDLPPIVLDEPQMKQVFMNLIINAIQAMPGGGAIRVTVQTDDALRQVHINVSDTGVGISEKHLNRIFDPFFTTKSAGKGTGLGLAVSYGIVERHGGEITVLSAPGTGATFTVVLPLDEAAQGDDDAH
ncbi:hypothetical protein D3OALGA1CA_3933 [Olavius algarvensis associated proteobacterium Delta 3]|nr:hypothetical protein D3OALGB2SA_2119 [Olavius algarvensis associated proteobacterium Delta 3]CAB5142448.1 hypothetical protein D3OALGA1CA_3933 [Olavius algarvensis associated proteobacterium Delta 3]